MNDVGDDWFYDDNDDQGIPLHEEPDDSIMELMEFEWKEELGELHRDFLDESRRQRKAAKTAEARHKTAEARKLQQWAKEDEERRLRRGRYYRSIDDKWENQ